MDAALLLELTFLDGRVKLRVALAELKTVTAGATRQEALLIASTHGALIVCCPDAGDAEAAFFRKLIPLPYRVQMMHQMAVSGIRYALYIRGDADGAGAIIFAVLLIFTKPLTPWREFLTALLDKGAPWLSDGELPALPADFQFGHAADRDTIVQHLALGRFLRAHAANTATAVPSLAQLWPVCVDFWNGTKGTLCAHTTAPRAY